MKNKPSAFTLIELLVVIAIIGILSTITYVTYQGAQKRGRDQQRKADLAQLQAALQTYYSRNGTYPRKDTAEQSCDSSKGIGTVPCDNLNNGGNWNSTNSDLYRGLITDTGIMKSLPADPLQKQTTNKTNYYRYEPSPSSGVTCPTGWPTNNYCGYYLITRLESTTDYYCVSAGLATCPISPASF